MTERGNSQLVLRADSLTHNSPFEDVLGNVDG